MHRHWDTGHHCYFPGIAGNGAWALRRVRCVARRAFYEDDPRDLLGPPYSVAEHVFDEYDLDGCYITAHEAPR